MNRLSHVLHASLLFVLTGAPLAQLGCSGAGPEEGTAQSSEDDLKKKVKPKGGNGAFDLLTPAWSTSGFVGGFAFDGADLAIGARAEKVPGSYMLQTKSVASPLFGQNMTQNSALVPITAGNIAHATASGLRVRMAEPLTLGTVYVTLQPPSGITGYLDGRRGWTGTAGGVAMYAIAGSVQIGSAADNGANTVSINDGELKEIVLPVAKVVAQIDAYDPAYPTPSTCAAPTMWGGASGYQDNVPVRQQNGSAQPTFTVPQGARAFVGYSVYGMSGQQPTVSGQTVTFLFNRLEVDDVDVTVSGGSTQTVRGTFNVEYKDAQGIYRAFNCAAFPTHSGLDLPNGTYRIVSRATGPGGVVTSTDEVSFP